MRADVEKAFPARVVGRPRWPHFGFLGGWIGRDVRIYIKSMRKPNRFSRIECWNWQTKWASLWNSRIFQKKVGQFVEQSYFLKTNVQTLHELAYFFLKKKTNVLHTGQLSVKRVYFSARNEIGRFSPMSLRALKK